MNIGVKDTHHELKTKTKKGKKKKLEHSSVKNEKSVQRSRSNNGTSEESIKINKRHI